MIDSARAIPTAVITESMENTRSSTTIWAITAGKEARLGRRGSE